MVKIYEKNKALEDKKDLLDRSLVAVRSVYEKFYSQTPETKQEVVSVGGRCSSAGKYSSLYTCGPKAALKVDNIDEAQYLALNDRAINLYKESSYFTGVSSSRPATNELDPGLTGVAGAWLSGSNMECHYISNYIPEKKAATFAWGCNLRINDKYYPTSH